MKFLVTDIEFDFNTDMPDYYSVSFDDQQSIVNDNLGVWEADDALYPMGVTKADIYGATYDYLNAVTKLDDDRFTWGDGDSLDRERVRDFLVRNYGYSTDFDGGSLWIFDGTSLEETN